MRSLILYCLVTLAFLQGASTTTKIKDSKKGLSAVKSEKHQTSKQLYKIAQDIKSAEKSMVDLEKKIDILERDTSETQEEYNVLKVEFTKMKKDFVKTSTELEGKYNAFISILSEQFSVIFAMEQAHEPTQKSIISEEVYKAYKKHNAKALEALKSEIIVLKKHKKDKQFLYDKINTKIVKMVKKRETYEQKKLAKEKLLKKLSVNEEKYHTKLEKIVDKQHSLRATLAKLNILHTQEVAESQKQIAARKKAIRLEKERKRRIRENRALAKAKASLRKAKTKEAKKRASKAVAQAKKEQKEAYKDTRRIRNVNTSYKKSKTYNYRGKKTISPIAGARVIKKFGTYVDPVYKIKIFNESITLKAPSSNAKVKNILNGKIVFAGKSSMLGKVVVVAHSGKIHTVYAGLSKIAPNIRVGRKIKKGYVIGKVTSKLMFQATKNSKHINPLKLIRI